MAPSSQQIPPPNGADEGSVSGSDSSDIEIPAEYASVSTIIDAHPPSAYLPLPAQKQHLESITSDLRNAALDAMKLAFDRSAQTFSILFQLQL